MHLIGLRLKKKFPKMQWIVDFRDPWSEWDLWDSLKTGERARKKHRALELEVLTQSDLAVSISKFHVDRLIALGAKRCELVANGYDPRDFDHVQRVSTEKFVVRHLGSIDELRDPRPFMQALNELILEKKMDGHKISIEFIGPVNESFKSFVQENRELKTITHFGPAVPHSQVVQLYRSSSLLLLILAHTDIAAGNTPGKMYEYMASGTPIFGIGPEDGDAAEILNDTQCGKIIDRSQKDAMKAMLHEHYQAFITGKSMLTTGASPFSRKTLTEKFCQFIR
jgi:glycosyltransferase involved in cell wall biosynthesis